MDSMVKAVESEFRRYKTLAEGALAQVPEPALSQPGPGGGNSLAVICWHISGNLRSRFTDFLTSDGEKEWRKRDEEFVQRQVGRGELEQKWNQGWDALLGTLAALTDEQLDRSVIIRGQSLSVSEALLRALSHTSCHVGQIVYLAHALRGADWKYLSIPPGGSAAYNANPVHDKPLPHSEQLKTKKVGG